MISVGVLLNYTTSYLSPGGAAGGQTDGWTDRRGPGGPGRAGRAGEAPAAMVSPRHGPTDTSLCAAKAPQGRFYGWVPGPRIPGPRPPPPQGTQESVPRPLPNYGPKSSGPWTLPPQRSLESRLPPPSDSEVQVHRPDLPRGPRRPGPQPPPSNPGVQPGLPLWRRHSLASWRPGQREPHLFWSLAPWATWLPTYLSDMAIQDQGGGCPRYRKPSKSFWIFSPPLSSLLLASHHLQH